MTERDYDFIKILLAGVIAGSLLTGTALHVVMTI